MCLDLVHLCITIKTRRCYVIANEITLHQKQITKKGTIGYRTAFNKEQNDFLPWNIYFYWEILHIHKRKYKSIVTLSNESQRKKILDYLMYMFKYFFYSQTSFDYYSSLASRKTIHRLPNGVYNYLDTQARCSWQI